MQTLTSIFTNKKTVVTLLGMLMMIIASFVPGFKLNVTELASLIIVISAYILALAKDPGQDNWKSLLLSRKFWTALVGVILIMIQSFGKVLPAGMDADMLVGFSTLIGSLVYSFAVEKKPEPEFDPETSE